MILLYENIKFILDCLKEKLSFIIIKVEKVSK